MFTPEEIQQHIEGAMAQYDNGHNERAALRAQIAQAEALTVIAAQLAELVTVIGQATDDIISATKAKR